MKSLFRRTRHALIHTPDSSRPRKGHSGLRLALFCTVIMFAFVLSLPAQTFSRWSNVENLTAVNSPDRESCLFVTNSGLSLYFASTRPGGSGGLDIYVSQRATRNDPWGEPKNLGAAINTPAADQLPFITPDGHTMLFATTRTGDAGGYDIYASFRRNAADDFAWEAAVPVSELNTSSHDFAAWGFEDPVSGRLVVYLSSNRPGGPGSFDTYVSTLGGDGKFSTPTLVPELSTAAVDYLPTLRKDGLEMFLTSNRPGGFGEMDLWTSTRTSTSQPWSAPVNLGPTINTSGSEERGATFGDGRDLYFFSARDGAGLDLYRATRTRTAIIPIAGSTGGAHGNVFRTSANLSNPGDAEITGHIVFHPAGVVAGDNDPRYLYRLAPYESQTLADLMASIGVSGIGSLEIVPERGAPPAVAIRIANGGSSFIVPAVEAEHVMVAGMHSAMKMPSDTNRYRTNVGLRTLDSGATIWVCMHDPDGTYIRGFNRYFPANYLVQMPVAELMGGEVKADQMVMFTVKAGSAVVFASTVENGGTGTTMQIVRPIAD